MTAARPSLVMARAIERVHTEHAEYQRAREWFVYCQRRGFSGAVMERARLEAHLARALWQGYASLLREPTWTERMALGIDADELAAMAS